MGFYRIFKSGISKTDRFWCVIQNEINNECYHAIINLTRSVDGLPFLELPADIERKVKWFRSGSASRISIPATKLLNRGNLGINHVLEFGLYRGYQIGIVYAFDYLYLEWCIENIEDFFITDIELLHEYGVIKIPEKYSFEREIHIQNEPLMDTYDSIQELFTNIPLLNNSRRFSDTILINNNRKMRIR